MELWPGTLQCTGSPPLVKNYLALNVNSAEVGENGLAIVT